MGTICDAKLRGMKFRFKFEICAKYWHQKELYQTHHGSPIPLYLMHLGVWIPRMNPAIASQIGGPGGGQVRDGAPVGSDFRNPLITLSYPGRDIQEIQGAGGGVLYGPSPETSLRGRGGGGVGVHIYALGYINFNKAFLHEIC